jgi:hypothetical protein
MWRWLKGELLRIREIDEGRCSLATWVDVKPDAMLSVCAPSLTRTMGVEGTGISAEGPRRGDRIEA